MPGKYENLTKTQLVELLEKRERTKKLGLVWERDELEADAAVDANFVACELIEEFCDKPSPWHNLVIEGDNYDALRWLRMTHSGKVKCIYIDPPYNTGNKDWVYNDRFMDSDNKFRQSTWLEFLYRRLTLARDLLSEDGVIFISINDDQRALLEMLMNEVLPGMRVGSLVWRTKDTANDAEHNFSSVHEHVLVYGKPNFSFFGYLLDDGKYRNPDQDSRGTYSSNPITQPKTRLERENGYYPIQDPTTGWWYPCNPDSVWRYASETIETSKKKLRSDTIEALIKDKRIIFPATEFVVYQSLDEIRHAIESKSGPIDGNGRQLLRLDLPDLAFWVGRKIALGRPSRKSFWNEKKHTFKPVGSMSIGVNQKKYDDLHEIVSEKQGKATGEIISIFGSKVFQYPKPATLIKSLLEAAIDDDALVLDFFAGSGTTAQAVMELNAQDGGSRRFILVSSTERTLDEPDKNVCRDVTAERVRILNESQDAGYVDLAADFAYLRTKELDFEDIDYDLTPSEAWTALEAMHGLPLTVYEPSLPHNIHAGEGVCLILVDRFETSLSDYLKGRDLQNLFVYSWAPGQVAQFIDTNAFEIRSVRATLVRGFQQ